MSSFCFSDFQFIYSLIDMVTYVSYHYRLNPWLIEYISYLMQLELFFKVGYVCTMPKGVERNRIVLSLQSYYNAMILLVVMKCVIILP